MAVALEYAFYLHRSGRLESSILGNAPRPTFSGMVRRRPWLSPVASDACIRTDNCTFRTRCLLVSTSRVRRSEFLEISHALGVAAHRNYLCLSQRKATILPCHLSSVISRVDAWPLENAPPLELDCAGAAGFVSLRNDSRGDSKPS